MGTINAFTVDLEDWFQGLTSTNPKPEKWPLYEPRLEANTLRLLAFLDQYHVQATFFVLGHVADQYPDLIRRIDAAGHEIGVHGYWHRRVHHLTPERFAAELEQARHVLSLLVSSPIVGHRAPYFSVNDRSLWALDVLRDQGFRYDSSFLPTRNMLYGYSNAPRFPHRAGNGDGLMEFPVSTARWGGGTWPIGGGFYVRVLPYRIVRAGILQLNRQGQPAIMYMHPWELDTAQRYNRVTPRERITHYYGRRGLKKKLERLFTDFEFTSLRNILESEYSRSDRR